MRFLHLVLFCIFLCNIAQARVVRNVQKLLPAVQGKQTKNSAQNLFQAAANNDRASVERLLAAGADARAKNSESKTPFHVAVDAEYDVLAAILLQAAAGINGKDEKGWTPLMWAILSSDWDLVREFIREDASISVGRYQNALDVAVLIKSEIKLLEAFIAEKGVDAINATIDPYNGTPLMEIASRGCTAAAEFLIECGADVNFQPKSGYTALMEAVHHGHIETIELLIEHGANINLQTVFGDTALIRAIALRQTKVVELLIEHGANLDLQTRYGNTALDLALRRKKNTMLYFAARKEYNKIVNILHTAQATTNPAPTKEAGLENKTN